jgi:hypothetical protein
VCAFATKYHVRLTCIVQVAWACLWRREGERREGEEQEGEAMQHACSVALVGCGRRFVGRSGMCVCVSMFVFMFNVLG